MIKDIESGEIGCALVAMPYFRLAKKAFDKNLSKEKLEGWIKSKEKYFLEK